VATDAAGLRGVAPDEQMARQLASSREVRRALREQSDCILLQQAGHAQLRRLAAAVLTAGANFVDDSGAAPSVGPVSGPQEPGTGSVARTSAEASSPRDKRGVRPEQLPADRRLIQEVLARRAHPPDRVFNQARAAASSLALRGDS
jgi:hypothetical protein